MEFYTYAYMGDDGIPYYIGKGKNDRAYQDHGLVPVPPPDRILILKRNLEEEDAFRHEIYMIDVFGRLDLGTGSLMNRTFGGEGGSGAIRTPDQRETYSKAVTLFWSELSEDKRKERIEAVSKSLQNRSEEEKAEWKKRISETQLNRTPEEKRKRNQKISEKTKLGRSQMTEEQLRSMIENQQRALDSRSEKEKRESNEKRSRSMKLALLNRGGPIQKGKSWWCDPYTGKTTLAFEPPNSVWIPGRKLP